MATRKKNGTHRSLLNSNQLQQGDVQLERVESIPADAILLSHRVLREGEHTGHMHALSATDAEIYELDGVRYARIKTPTPLTHQEHATAFIEPGDYAMYPVQEYDHFLEESREVVD